MTTLATVTITAPSTARDKKHQEVQLIHRALELAKVEIRAGGGVKTSGNLTDDGGVVIGSWSYTPVAGS